jgi:hypothetical protein
MDKYIRIDLTKATVFLTETEIRRLLHSDSELYTAALKRGKAIKRSTQRQKREENCFDALGDWEGL